MGNFDERPNRIPWPPILFGLALALGFFGGWLMPLAPAGWPFPLAAIGWAGVAGAVALMGWAFLAFRRAKANILPHRAATTVIATGPFAFSRNPIYLSEAIILASLAAATGSAWWLVAAGLFVSVATRLAIVREEAHMAAQFGAAWAEYAARVRRWL
jgi:protein-S-isoprenylcysteine O-methyltransferase Ste14